MGIIVADCSCGGRVPAGIPAGRCVGQSARFSVPRVSLTALLDPR